MTDTPWGDPVPGGVIGGAKISLPLLPAQAPQIQGSIGWYSKPDEPNSWYYLFPQGYSPAGGYQVVPQAPSGGGSSGGGIGSGPSVGSSGFSGLGGAPLGGVSGGPYPGGSYDPSPQYPGQPQFTDTSQSSQGIVGPGEGQSDYGTYFGPGPAAPTPSFDASGNQIPNSSGQYYSPEAGWYTPFGYNATPFSDYGYTPFTSPQSSYGDTSMPYPGPGSSYSQGNQPSSGYPAPGDPGFDASRYGTGNDLYQGPTSYYNQTRDPGNTPFVSGQTGWINEGPFYQAQYDNPQDVPGTSLIPRQPSDATSMSTPNPVTNPAYAAYNGFAAPGEAGFNAALYGTGIDLYQGPTSYYNQTRDPSNTPFVPGQTGWENEGAFYQALYDNPVPATSPSEQVSMGFGKAPTGGPDPYFGAISGGYPSPYDAGFDASRYGTGIDLYQGPSSYYNQTRDPSNTPFVPGQIGWENEGAFYQATYPDQTVGQAGPGSGGVGSSSDYTTLPPAQPADPSTYQTPWQRSIPSGYNSPDLVNAITQGAGAIPGLDPSSLAAMFAEESTWNPKSVTGGNYGLPQMSENMWGDYGGNFNNLTFSQFKDATPSQQVGAYVDWLTRSGNLNKGGIDLGSMLSSVEPAYQSAILQAIQFAPNSMPWRTALANGDLTAPIVSRDIAQQQASDLRDASGNITLASMAQAYRNRMAGWPQQ